MLILGLQAEHCGLPATLVQVHLRKLVTISPMVKPGLRARTPLTTIVTITLSVVSLLSTTILITNATLILLMMRRI